MARCAQLLQERTNIDFIDINCGCPIDLVYKKVSVYECVFRVIHMCKGGEIMEVFK